MPDRLLLLCPRKLLGFLRLTCPLRPSRICPDVPARPNSGLPNSELVRRKLSDKHLFTSIQAFWRNLVPGYETIHEIQAEYLQSTPHECDHDLEKKKKKQCVQRSTCTHT